VPPALPHRLTYPATGVSKSPSPELVPASAPASAPTLPRPLRRWLSAGVLSCYGTTSDEDKDDDDGYAAALAADAAALAAERKEPPSGPPRPVRESALGGYGSCTYKAAEWKNRLRKEQRKDLAAALCTAKPSQPVRPPRLKCHSRPCPPRPPPPRPSPPRPSPSRALPQGRQTLDPKLLIPSKVLIPSAVPSAALTSIPFTEYDPASQSAQS
jgi:hypothetical protein